MTPEHHSNKREISLEFVKEFEPKYERGQKEHGSNFWLKGLLFHARNCREEVIDQVAYTHEMQKAITSIHQTVKAALLPNTPDCTLRDYLGRIKILLEGSDQSGS